MIIVDDREPPQIFKKFEKFEIPHERAVLPVGDFVDYDKNLCIERKSVCDFIQSMITGHLQKQLLNMQENFKHNYLVISGNFEDLFFNKHFRWFDVDKKLGMLASTAVRYDVKMIQVANDNQLVQLVKKLHSKTADGKEPMQEVFSLPYNKRDTFLSILMCIPNISVVRAQKIRKKYTTIPNLIVALKDSSFDVQGLYKREVKELKKVFLE